MPVRSSEDPLHAPELSHACEHAPTFSITNLPDLPTTQSHRQYITQFSGTLGNFQFKESEYMRTGSDGSFTSRPNSGQTKQ